MLTIKDRMQNQLQMKSHRQRYVAHEAHMITHTECKWEKAGLSMKCFHPYVLWQQHRDNKSACDMGME